MLQMWKSRDWNDSNDYVWWKMDIVAECIFSSVNFIAQTVVGEHLAINVLKKC